MIYTRHGPRDPLGSKEEGREHDGKNETKLPGEGRSPAEIEGTRETTGWVCAILGLVVIYSLINSQISYIYMVYLALAEIYYCLLFCFRGYSDNTDLSDFDDHDEDEVTEVRGHSSLKFFLLWLASSS